MCLDLLSPGSFSFGQSIRLISCGLFWRGYGFDSMLKVGPVADSLLFWRGYGLDSMLTVGPVADSVSQPAFRDLALYNTGLAVVIHANYYEC